MTSNRAVTVFGAYGQIFAALYPERVRSLTLTDCDTHDNWPPEAFKPFPCDGCCRRFAWNVGRDVVGQERLSITARLGTSV